MQCEQNAYPRRLLSCRGPLELSLNLSRSVDSGAGTCFSRLSRLSLRTGMREKRANGEEEALVQVEVE
jgi:hypothetical protein